MNPQEICEASVGFLDLLGSTGYGKLLGSVSYQSNELGLKYREYNSLEKFPYAQKTIIIDTNGLSRYRQLKAPMFNAIGKMFDGCLTTQKYVADYSPQLVKMHEIKMAYKYQIPSKEKSLFSNLQFDNTLVLEIYIDKKKNGDATYTYDFYLHFKRV